MQIFEQMPLAENHTVGTVKITIQTADALCIVDHGTDVAPARVLGDKIPCLISGRVGDIIKRGRDKLPQIRLHATTSSYAALTAAIFFS